MKNFVKLTIIYRPGQPNWEYTIWKLQDFSATQIFREINYGYFEALKNMYVSKIDYNTVIFQENGNIICYAIW